MRVYLLTQKFLIGFVNILAIILAVAGGGVRTLVLVSCIPGCHVSVGLSDSLRFRVRDELYTYRTDRQTDGHSAISNATSRGTAEEKDDVTANDVERSLT